MMVQEMHVTRPLSEKGWNISAMIVLLMKYKYTLPDTNRKWREHLSLDHGEAHEMGLRTH